MNTTSFAMSGLHRLGAEQSEFLRTLGLEVSDVQTTAQMQELLQRAEVEIAKMSNPFVQGMSRDMLSELRTAHGL